MFRFLFFLLLLAATGLGLHLWLTAATDKADYSTRERNRDEVRIVAVTPPALAAKNSEDTQRAQQALAGAACVEFLGHRGRRRAARPHCLRCLGPRRSPVGAAR